MMDCYLAYLYWTVRVEPVALVMVVSFLAVITLVWILNSRMKNKKFGTVLGFFRRNNSIFGVATKTINKDLKKQNNGRIKASDFEEMFHNFKELEIYNKTVTYLINNDENEKPDMNEFKAILNKHFNDFIKYLCNVSPDLIDTDIDYCILTLAGFKQKDMYKLMNSITPSGIRNIKSRLRNKLPAYLYNSFFNVDHLQY